VDALLCELASRREDFAGRRLASLYLGGGTPSLLQPASVARIVEAVCRAFPGAGPLEVTLEVNPSTVERERLPGFRAAGVGRLSVGVQSFDDVTLRRLGRAHRAEEAHRTLAACRETAFESLSIDLIVAAPGQRMTGLDADLDALLAYTPDHVSCYELTVEAGTPFATAAARGQLARPSEEEALAMLERVETRLAAAGYHRYELSNYARPGAEALHNRRYWERRPVLGLGLSAVSTDPPTRPHPFGVRRQNPRDLASYLEQVECGTSPPAEVLDAPTARGEAAFLALRTARGLEAAGFAAEFGGPPRRYFAAAIEQLVAARLLDEDPAGNLRLTPDGRMLSDSVFEHFV
jgi:oxygen-independent coproporphyrinogen-3 oxidase